MIQVPVAGHDPRWVPPFGHPRIEGRVRLPGDYRGLPRPSSTFRAKASAVRLWYPLAPRSAGPLRLMSSESFRFAIYDYDGIAVPGRQPRPYRRDRLFEDAISIAIFTLGSISKSDISKKEISRFHAMQLSRCRGARLGALAAGCRFG